MSISQTIVVTSFVQGFGFGLVFIPINVLAFATLPRSHRTEASSIMNLFRGVGSSIGISVVTVLLARNMQISHADLASNVTGESGGAMLDFKLIGPVPVARRSGDRPWSMAKSPGRRR